VDGIDRRRKQIRIACDNGETETFRLTDRAASETPADLDQKRANTARIVIYYSDEAGQKVAYFVKKSS
jgi:hypothetical protein